MKFGFDKENMCLIYSKPIITSYLHQHKLMQLSANLVIFREHYYFIGLSLGEQKMENLLKAVSIIQGIFRML
jgi:hypothetical protein